MIGLDAHLPCVIGLDVGGSKIAGGVVCGPTGAIFTRKVIPTHAARGGERVLQDALALARELSGSANAAGLSVAGIGIVVCELVDLDGIVTSGNAVAWRGIPLRERFAEFGTVVVDADVRGAALAEARLGAGRGLEVFAYVTVGTGISYCLVQHGKPYAGAHGSALVLGTFPLGVADEPNVASSPPLLEAVAAGPAIVASYNRTAGKNVTGAEQVLSALNAGDPLAVQVVDRAAGALGQAIGFLIDLLDPEAVIVGGGLGLAGGAYWERVVQAARKHIWSDTNQSIPIMQGALGPDAALIGAALLAQQK